MQAVTFFFAFVAVLALIGARRLAGSPIRRQPPRRQHQSRTDAAAGRDRRRRRGRPPAAGAGAARQHRTSADDRRPDRYRRGTQYRARDARDATRCRNGPAVGSRTAAPDCAAARSGWTRRRGRKSDAFDRSCRAANAGAAAAPGAALLCRRNAPRRMRLSERRSDPLAGFAPEPLGNPLGGPPGASPRTARRADAVARDIAQRTADPASPRPSEAAEGAAGARDRNAPPPPPPPAASPICRQRTKISPRWRNGWKPRCAGRPATPANRGSARRRWRPNRRRTARRAAQRAIDRPRRLPRRRRRAALKISKTRWRHCWAVQRPLREIGAIPA